MNDYPNIEIINFEQIHEEPNLNCAFNFQNNDFGDFLEMYTDDKYCPGYYDNNESMDIYRSNSFTNMLNNDSSFDSYFSNDMLSCNSEIINTHTQSFLSDRSFHSVDINETSSTKKAKKIFTCPDKDCAKVYKSKENLTLHYKNIHLKEKPYSCKFCAAVFSHRNGNIEIYP
jgi:hypothetical protein